ncbi:hypothetical protein STEG23_000791, partial [Scotinomys teguina]
MGSTSLAGAPQPSEATLVVHWSLSYDKGFACSSSSFLCTSHLPSRGQFRSATDADRKPDKNCGESQVYGLGF